MLEVYYPQRNIRHDRQYQLMQKSSGHRTMTCYTSFVVGLFSLDLFRVCAPRAKIQTRIEIRLRIRAHGALSSPAWFLSARPCPYLYHISLITCGFLRAELNHNIFIYLYYTDVSMTRIRILLYGCIHISILYEYCFRASTDTWAPEILYHFVCI